MEQKAIEITKRSPQEGSDFMNHQVVDPVISKRKFDEETNSFSESSAIHRGRGIFVLDQKFPDIKIAFCATQLKPLSIVFAVNINYTNYDLEPLSVEFIHPLTFQPLTAQQLGHPFLRKIGIANGKPNLQPLVLGIADRPAFICLPGVREYHMHPDHSNDPWLVHRGIGGEGSLGYIIDKLYQYGITSITSLNVQVNFVNATFTIDGNKVSS